MRSFIPLALTCLASCSYVPVRTLAEIATLDPMTADPGGFELVVNMPEGLRVREGGARIGFTSRRSDTGEGFDSSYVVEELSQADGTHLFRVNPADLDQMRAEQALAAKWETEAPRENSGSLTVNVTGCLDTPGWPEDDRITAGLRLRPGGPVLPLVRDVSLAEMMGGVPEEFEDAVC